MKARILALLPVLCCACATTAPEPPPVATFSIVAFDRETGDLGVAVQSKFFGVGSVVPWARADVGAIATQAWANTTYGPDGLDLLAAGKSPDEVVKALTAADAGRERRQVGVVDAKGRAASFTGREALAWAGHVVGDGFACQGNILAGEGVVQAMAKACRESKAPLPERLVAALRAGQAAGGDRRGRQSAALLVVRRRGGYSGWNDRYVDIRVEDHETPIEELSRLLALHRKFYGTVPLPSEREGFEMEPAPTGGPVATPRAAFETWVRTFRARDFEALHALYASDYRRENPLEAFTARMRERAESIDSFLEKANYAGTRIRGDRAWVAIDHPGAPVPELLRYVRESGAWRLLD